ncbi:putative uncharacterized protein DDB_G0282133 [Nylanderia fulva]|uniref:putative uncharacterized protein DDB_G0282133 n=1 Tax=Nylanderia fulva TaxID=613905 RepID=UPI0010FB1BC0|nr:putative uncharacterized protein DDB_G0282133 [Nylanderia fulva]
MMDDVNINEICLHLEEVEVETGDENEWIKLNWINKQSDDNETLQSSNLQKEDSNSESSQTKDNKVSSVSTEAEDISDGISVITESDTDTVPNNLQLRQFNGNTCGPLWMLETRVNNQGNIRNVVLACIIGIVIGFILSHSFITPEANPNSNGINTESLKTVSHNIVNTCKALTEVKTMLNEIKARTAVDKKIIEHFIEQLSNIDSTNKMGGKPTVTSESFNFDQYSLDQVSQLQMSLHVLSSFAFIYGNNSSLKNEISKTLDIVNSTKLFYENLILFNNNTQNEYNSLALKILQHDSDKIHITSKSLLSNLIEKMSKITLNVYNKYTKQRYKVIKKLCDLKNILPDDEFLKRLTENNELFKNYDKSCVSNYSSKKFNTKTSEKRNTKIKNVKEWSKKADNTAFHENYDKKNGHKKRNDDNEKNYLKKKSTKKLNEHNYTIPKFFHNGSDKIYNTSQLLFSDSIGKMNTETLNKRTCTKCNKATQTDKMSKDNFDNVLHLWKDSSSLSTNYCSRSNIEDVPITLNCKTENCIVNSNNKHNANKESVSDYKSSAKVMFEKSKPKQKDYSKSSDSTKKVFNNDNKNIKEKKKMPSQNKMKNHVSENNNYHKSIQSSFNSRITKQDDQDYINSDWQSDNERFDVHKKQRYDDTSDWYFQRAFSRRNARKHAEDLYQRNTMLWKKRRYNTYY